jgi:hypothetical protein
VKLPDTSSITRFLSRVRHPAPGPDCVPYGMWRIAGPIGAVVLRNVLHDQCASLPTLPEFNESRGVFPAKGVKDDDGLETVKRGASEVRPLSW